MKTQPLLLLSCYELGHQPLSLAWPLAALNAAGLPVTATDLAVEEFPAQAAAEAALVAIAVPMHTALRIGVDAARRVRALNPTAHICFFGLYAWMNRAYLLGGEAKRRGGEEARIGDSVIGGEVEPVLVDLARAVLAGDDPAGVPGVTTAAGEAEPHLARLTFPLPARATLPPLESYARYMADGAAHLAGYVEASRGCLHTCRHCPVVPIYNGRFFIVPVETVLADIRQQVEAGARHITFGDPDFLNGPGHARKIAQALHSEFPDVTFDFTTKVEHILQHQDLIPELAACGATFVVSAFESTSEVVLARLHKGHTLTDMDAAIAILRNAGLAPQPTWMPFTPWTSLDDYLHLLAWIRCRDLILYVPAVQLSIRMLVPPGSALLAEPDTLHWIGDLDAGNFSYRWAHPDPRMDELQRTVAQVAEQAGDDANPYDTFALVEHAAYSLAHQLPPAPAALPRITVQPPRMTEHWFC
jgi:hypothetical protein